MFIVNSPITNLYFTLLFQQIQRVGGCRRGRQDLYPRGATKQVRILASRVGKNAQEVARHGADGLGYQAGSRQRMRRQVRRRSGKSQA